MTVPNRIDHFSTLPSGADHPFSLRTVVLMLMGRSGRHRDRRADLPGPGAIVAGMVVSSLQLVALIAEIARDSKRAQQRTGGSPLLASTGLRGTSIRRCFQLAV